MSLLDALDQLSRAHGAAALLDAFRAIRQQVWKGRREAARTDGKLAAAYLEIVAFIDTAKASGTPQDVIARSVEAVLRDVWPKPKSGRDEPWHYLCESCGDTGLEIHDCPGDARCGRSRRHDPHTFGRPCFCALGRRFVEKTKAERDPVAAAAKVAKAPSRFGQR